MTDVASRWKTSCRAPSRSGRLAPAGSLVAHARTPRSSRLRTQLSVRKTKTTNNRWHLLLLFTEFVPTLMNHVLLFGASGSIWQHGEYPYHSAAVFHHVDDIHCTETASTEWSAFSGFGQLNNLIKCQQREEGSRRRPRNKTCWEHQQTQHESGPRTRADQRSATSRTTTSMLARSQVPCAGQNNYICA